MAGRSHLIEGADEDCDNEGAKAEADDKRRPVEEELRRGSEGQWQEKAEGWKSEGEEAKVRERRLRSEGEGRLDGVVAGVCGG